MPEGRSNVLAERSWLGIYSSDVVCIGLNHHGLSNWVRSPRNYTPLRDSSNLKGKKLNFDSFHLPLLPGIVPSISDTHLSQENSQPRRYSPDIFLSNHFLALNLPKNNQNVLFARVSSLAPLRGGNCLVRNYKISLRADTLTQTIG